MTHARSSELFTVPFGRSHLSFCMPPGVTATVIRSRQVPPLDDARTAIREAVMKPVGASLLRELARGKRRVCIAVTDATRSCPDALLVPPMLEELAAAGVPDEAITILVAVGAHRASTDAEKREKLGEAIVDRYRVVDHDAHDVENLVPVANGPDGQPFLINRMAAEADLLLATGRVEPHQYAGYSGGGKTVAIGCAGESVIVATHGPAMLDRPGVRLAQLSGNPFQEAVRRVARSAGLAWVANCVLDEDERMVAVAFGAPEAVHDHLAAIASAMCTVPIPAQVDIAIAGVGYPKDQNLYQASRAASYLQFAPVPVVRKGGVIIIPAACPEGVGQGVGEQSFMAAMQDPGGPAAIITKARREGIRPGQQRAYIMARVLEDVTVMVVGAVDPEAVRAVGCVPVMTMEEALDRAVSLVGAPATSIVVPHALQTLPVVTGGEGLTRERRLGRAGAVER